MQQDAKRWPIRDNIDKFQTRTTSFANAGNFQAKLLNAPIQKKKVLIRNVEDDVSLNRSFL